MAIFWVRGCHVLIYDPRGTGASSSSLKTLGYEEKNDAKAAVDWLADYAQLPAASIGLWGVSLGAATGLELLRLRDDLAFVIADSSYRALPVVIEETIAGLYGPLTAEVFSSITMWFITLRTGMDVASVSPETAILDRLTPVLLVHAKEDPAMPVAHSERIYAARNTDRVSFEVTDWGAGHGDSAQVDQTAYSNLIETFFTRHESTIGFLRGGDHE